MWKIERIELAAIITLAVFSIVWIVVVLPYMIDSWFSTLIPPFQYILYNLGFITLSTVLMGIPLSFFVKRKLNLSGIFRGGLASWLSFSFVLDMLQPPLAYSSAGALLITDKASLAGVAVDTVAGWLWNQVGISGSTLFTFVYVVTPLIAVIVAALLLKPKELMKMFAK